MDAPYFTARSPGIGRRTQGKFEEETFYLFTSNVQIFYRTVILYVVIPLRFPCVSLAVPALIAVNKITVLCTSSKRQAPKKMAARPSVCRHPY
jgi:hypothetical protein